MRERYRADPEAGRAKAAAYRASHPEWVKRQTHRFKEWLAAHPDKARRATANWKKRHPERIRPKKRRHDWKKKYGITEADYFAMLDRQGGVCAICGGVERSGRMLAVDHDHTTGKVRALLCTPCNVLVGAIETERGPKALAYIEQYRSA